MENNIIYELCYNYEYNGKCNDKCKYIHFDRSKCEISEELKKLEKYNYKIFCGIINKKEELRRLDEEIKEWALLEDELSEKVNKIYNIQNEIIFLENEHNKYLNEIDEIEIYNNNEVNNKNNNLNNIPVELSVNGTNIENIENIFDIIKNKKDEDIDIIENKMEELIDNVKYNIRNSNIDFHLKIKFIIDLNKILYKIRLFKMNWIDLKIALRNKN